MAPSPSTSDAASAFAARDKVSKLLTAACDGDLNRFKEAAQAMADGQSLAKTIVDVKDANGRVPLHFAARNGKDEICKYLLEELTMPVDPRDNDGETPLIHAVRQGHFETARFFIEHGADPLATSKDSGTTALHHAAGTGSVDMIRLLLEKGVSVDTPSDAGTPLIWAAGHDRPDAVKTLLDFGANPNVATDDDVTPLLTAAAAGSSDIVELLVQKGADVNVSAGGGTTSLHIAADHENEKMVACLLEAGANPNAVDDEGTKPLQAAAVRGNRGVVEILLPVTIPEPNVSDWTVDGVLAYAEHLVSHEQELLESNKKNSDKNQGKEDIKTPLVEISHERTEKALEAKARGDEAFKKKNFTLAMDAYTQALDLDPHSALVFSNRSLCWIRLGQAEHALTDAKAARAIRPDWSKACYREGSALRLLQRFDEAADAFYEGVKLDPENKELVDAFREAVEAGRNFYGTK